MRSVSNNCAFGGRRRLELAFAALGLGLATAMASAGGSVEAQPKMGDPLAGLTTVELERFFAGRVSYDRNFVAEEGLGPIFNQTSCGSCHSNPLGGPGSVTVTRAGIDDKGEFDDLAEFGGSLFQQESISEECREVVPPFANIVSLRATNGMMGYGLVQAIPDGDLMMHALNPPSDEVSGLVNWVTAVDDLPAAPLRVGRFGWKADVATMLHFSAGAAFNEVGLTNPFHPEENDPNGINPPAIDDCDMVPDLEVGITFLLQLEDFQRFLAAPPQTPKSGMMGEDLFMAVGCGDCHVPGFTTADDASLEDALRNKPIRPYADFLLHNMGLAGDPIAQGPIAVQQEVKTAPLAGLRSRDPLWHDASVAGGTFADRIMTSIQKHDSLSSESVPSAQRFLGTFPGKGNLDKSGREAVIAFLDSLGRGEFDHDGDNHVDVSDFNELRGCFGLAGVSPDEACAISDVNQDGTIDLDDALVFLTVYEDGLVDCNLNGENDLIDILLGDAVDDNGNGVPDSCEGNGDINGDGVVNAEDLALLLGNWGPCPGCPADLTGDGVVGPVDLAILLGNWG